MTLDVYNTHMELYPYKKDDYPIIEDMYMIEDKYSHTIVPCGFMIEDGKLFLPRGTPISKIERLTGCEVKFIKESDPVEPMDRHHHSLYDPKDKIQEESIAFLKEDERQQALNLKTGYGKTFAVAYASTELSERTIIITPNNTLKKQWIKTYREMFGYRPKNLMDIAGSEIMEMIMADGLPQVDVYFVNHQTLRSYMNNHNGFMLHKFFKKIAVGIKVYDEAHMEFANILMIDSFSNTNRTWYLTATFDRSSKTESRCFKQAFSSVVTYGEVESREASVKHTIYHVVRINSHISPKNRGKVSGYQGMTAASYGQYAFFDDPTQAAYNTILEILKKTNKLDGKTLIFVPLIAAVDDVVKRLKKDVPEKSIAAYHSKISNDEKDSAKKKDIIVSTIKSCGTGVDIPGLRCMISVEPIASKVVAEQMFGRLRPYAEGKNTFYFDIVDTCIGPINWWFNARFKKIQTLAKEVIYLSI